MLKLQTKRFVLRDFAPADTPAFLAYHADPRSSQFYPSHQATRQHAEDLLSTFQRWAVAQPRLNFQLAVFRLREPQDLVGCVGLRSEDLPQNEAEFGIEIAPQFWGLARYAVEISNAMLEFGFTDRNLDVISGTTASENSRIIKLARWYGAEIQHANSRDDNTLCWRLTRDRWRRGKSLMRLR